MKRGRRRLPEDSVLSSLSQVQKMLREQSQPDPGAIVVAVVSDQVYVKRLRRPGGGRTRLQSADGSLLADSPEQTFRVVQIRRDV